MCTRQRGGRVEHLKHGGGSDWSPSGPPYRVAHIRAGASCVLRHPSAADRLPSPVCRSFSLAGFFPLVTAAATVAARRHFTSAFPPPAPRHPPPFLPRVSLVRDRSTRSTSSPRLRPRASFRPLSCLPTCCWFSSCSLLLCRSVDPFNLPCFPLALLLALVFSSVSIVFLGLRYDTTWSVGFSLDFFCLSFLMYLVRFALALPDF